MRKKQSAFTGRVTQPSRQIEQDAAEIEWDETQGTTGGDVMDNIRRELRQGLEQVARECLRGDLSQDETNNEDRQQQGLLDIELRKALKRSPRAHDEYQKREREFQQRIKKQPRNAYPGKQKR